MKNFDLSFYKNKKVLVTGHTGFKGSWMCKVLLMAGAQVIGYSLEPPTEPSLFKLCGMDSSYLKTIIGDITDLDLLKKTFDEVQPEIVIHMAAQPIVRESYINPVGTYASNVMGTVNILECVRLNPCVKSFVNVTTDKVYLNREWSWGYRENEELNGYDPYSNSKSCSELVTYSYKNAFFGGETGERADKTGTVAITTMRAGNVIGGGDFAKDRIIPDCIRAVEKGEVIGIRNPYSTRPYQHVLEPVMAYLMVAKAQYEDISKAGNYNIGPDDCDCFTTGNIVELFCNKWNDMNQTKAASWKNMAEENAPHEANFLKLDCSKIKATFGWKPVWNLDTVIEKIAEWNMVYFANKDSDILSEKISECMEKQIKEYMK